MTNLIDFFEKYVLDRRRQELELYILEDLGYLIRYTPKASAEGLVTFSRIQPPDVEKRIDEQINYFSSLKRSFEWKIYDFDEPRDLKSLLINRGFVAGEPGVFMVFSTGNALAQAPLTGAWRACCRSN